MSDIARAAQALAGARFRLHGRSAETGLDCVGVAALATGVRAPTGYPLRGMATATAVDWIEGAGFRAVDSGGPGDLMLLRTGPGQLHLAVKTERGFVHADAGLRRVVERPGAPEWEILGIWRRLS
ncbi:peptidoglycan endopeptidase [Sphingomonas tabacisoli]|uniref:Peptidoglycan endopeptidase n=1 Tax=Sphingomonas tabacisoli TaxID=2249466 RepID=A0ABW4I0C4_9SPHN